MLSIEKSKIEINGLIYAIISMFNELKEDINQPLNDDCKKQFNKIIKTIKYMKIEFYKQTKSPPMGKMR